MTDTPDATPAEPDPRDVTLATIRNVVERELATQTWLPPEASQWAVHRMAHARGRQAAMRDIQAILDVHGQPAGQPVEFRAET